jgi:nucleotidyltransferase/DNA polymerase involved in DNA repair
MPILIVSFNLKPGVSEADYEAWARAVDLPTVRSHGSVQSMRVLKARHRWKSEAAGPYRYMELISIRDVDAFLADTASAKQAPVSARFREIATDVTAVLCDELEG